MTDDQFTQLIQRIDNLDRRVNFKLDRLQIEVDQIKLDLRQVRSSADAIEGMLSSAHLDHEQRIQKLEMAGA